MSPSAAYMRDYRRRKKLEKQLVPVEYEAPTDPAEVRNAFATWCEAHLKIPAGHKDEGKPFIIPTFALDYIQDAVQHRESLLCIARKNAKSAIIAAYILCRLNGALRIRGYRAGICSVSREKAVELYDQCKAIASFSNLRGIEFRRSPHHILGSTGKVDFLSADRSAGHASGFDDAIIDELGLIPERKRDLINGLRSSVSARNGRFIALSILGDSPFTREMIERKHLPTTSVHIYQSKLNCAIDDLDAWKQSNPGLGTIKSLEYMRDESARCITNPADESSFRAFDLNQPLHPTREMICSVTQYERCIVEDLPSRSDRCFIGLDIGGSNSMSAAVVVFLDTFRVETYCAFGGVPNLYERGKADGVGDLYARMQSHNELTVYANSRITPVHEFIRDVFDKLGNTRILALGADRYRKSEVIDALDRANKFCNVIWRGQGASATADGSHDVRAFQKAIQSQKFKMQKSLAWINAITESSVRYDVAGNPALDKRRNNSRIDVLQAGVIAAGLTALHTHQNDDSYTLRLV